MYAKFFVLVRFYLPFNLFFFFLRIKFIIQSRNLSFMHNFKYKNLELKHSINDIVIDLISY